MSAELRQPASGGPNKSLQPHICVPSATFADPTFMTAVMSCACCNKGAGCLLMDRCSCRCTLLHPNNLMQHVQSQ